jgi:hypothetical protein
MSAYGTVEGIAGRLRDRARSDMVWVDPSRDPVSSVRGGIQRGEHRRAWPVPVNQQGLACLVVIGSDARRAVQVCYPIAFGAEAGPVTHWVPAQVLKQKH